MSPRPTQTSRGRRAKFRVSTSLPNTEYVFIAAFVITLASFGLYLESGNFLWMTGLVGAALTVLGILSWPTTIEVGADGILLRSPWRKRRFIPIAIVEHVSPTGRRGIRLRYYNGAEEVLMTGPATAPGQGGIDHVREALYAEILEVAAAWNASDSSANAAARVARGTRTTEEWAELLRSMRAGGGDYRSSEMRDEDLWLVLESAAHPEDSRAAAAVILRDRGEEARKRIRVAAEASASPRLRIALEAASEARAREEEEILATLDEQPQRKMRR